MIQLILIKRQNDSSQGIDFCKTKCDSILGDLLLLKNSYSATFDYQQQEIETLMNELHLCEHDLKAKSAEFDRETQSHLREMSAMKSEMKLLQKTIGDLKSQNSAKGMLCNQLVTGLFISFCQMY